MLDALIIGQGIAGSMIGYHLIQKGLNVNIITNPSKEPASCVAAGLIQTISGRFLSIAEKSLDQIDYAFHYYKKLENMFKVQLIKDVPCYRFLTDEQIKKWQVKKEKFPYKTYLSPNFVKPKDNINSSLSFIEVFNNFHVNPNVLMDVFKTYFEGLNALIYDNFNQEKLHIHSHHIDYLGHRSKTIIFCMGHYSSTLKGLNHIEFQHIKGETQTLTLNDLRLDAVYQGSEWIVPFGDSTYKLGATYDRDLTLNITSTGQDKLNDFLNTLGVSVDQVITRQAGIRCVTKKRIPLIKQDDKHKQLFYFTGLGSKGFMTCPYLSNQFCDTFF